MKQGPPSRVPVFIFLCNIWACLVYVVVLLHNMDERISEILTATSISPEYVLIKKEL